MFAEKGLCFIQPQTHFLSRLLNDSIGQRFCVWGGGGGCGQGGRRAGSPQKHM